VGQTPRSAAGPPAGLWDGRKNRGRLAGPGGPAQTRRSAPLTLPLHIRNLAFRFSATNGAFMKSMNGVTVLNRLTISPKISGVTAISAGNSAKK